MGMGYMAAMVDVIDEKHVKKFCPKELEAFLSIAKGCDINIEEFASNAEFEDFDDTDKDVVKAYEALCDAFKKKTGLELGLAFHNQHDDGDRYDEISGLFWYVNGMYELTKAGKKMKKFVERKTFVQYG